MLVINIYTVLDEVVISVNRATAPVGLADSDPTLRNLHYCSAPVDAVSNPEKLSRVLGQALQHANGYAGDLIDHVSS